MDDFFVGISTGVCWSSSIEIRIFQPGKQPTEKINAHRMTGLLVRSSEQLRRQSSEVEPLFQQRVFLKTGAMKPRYWIGDEVVV